MQGTVSSLSQIAGRKRHNAATGAYDRNTTIFTLPVVRIR